MSYIRSTINPEELYIWSDQQGIVTIMRGSDIIGVIPKRKFDGVIETYVWNNYGDSAFEDCTITEIFEHNPEGSNFKMQLKYGDFWSINMWQVTWDWIVRQYEIFKMDRN